MLPRRTVIRIPVDRLYDDESEIEARRERWLSKSALQEILRQHPIEFFVADVGTPLRRVEVSMCYEFWKSEAKSHIVDNPDSRFRIEDFPDGYAYVASEWSGEIQTPIVLLEKYH